MSSPGKTIIFTGSTTTARSATEVAWYNFCPGYMKECHISHECRYTNGIYDGRKVR